VQHMIFAWWCLVWGALGWRPPVAVRRRWVVALQPLETSSAAVADETEREATELVSRVATALRDGEREGALVEACAVLKSAVSASNNAAKLSAAELASSLEEHRDVYAPLLEFERVEATSVEVDDYAATVVSSLAAASGIVTDVVWALSLGERGWRIDGVSVKPTADLDDDAASMAALTSPRWVASTVLDALRRVDEPDENAGCDVALSFVSHTNPSASLTREIFRSYLDDDDYPYGILTRWTEIRHDADVLFDDDLNPTTASVDVTLVDDDKHDRALWTVTLEMSKEPSRGWLIDRVWCHDY